VVPKKFHDVLLKIFTTDAESFGLKDVVFGLPLIRTVANVIEVVLEELTAFRSELAATNQQVQSCYPFLESNRVGFIRRHSRTNTNTNRLLLKATKLSI
jgi:hypothetical protein